MEKALKKLVLGGLLALFTIASCRQDEAIPEPSEPSPPTFGSSIKMIEDQVGDIPLIVAGSAGLNIVVAFQRNFQGQSLIFTPVQASLPVLLEDQLGNRWDVFGQAVSGPDQGSRLETVNTGMGFWFVFGAMYPGVDIHGIGGSNIDLNQDTLAGWNIPTSAVAQGSGFDGIAALNDPNFFTFNVLETDPSDPFYLEDDDLVIAVSVDGVTKVYPHAILDWHEVINDQIGNRPVTVTYCPLTGTAKVWERSGTRQEDGFGVSGLLYNSNVLPFDRNTESYWHQLEARSVFGERLGEQLTLIPHVETSWGTWKKINSTPLVLSTATGITRDYTTYPYGDYRSSNLIAYPLTFNDNSLPPKERVFSVIVDGKAKVYPLSDF